MIELLDSEKLCWKCLKEKDKINVVKINPMGYGSYFDCFGTEIHLCDDCLKESKVDIPELWDMEIVNIDGDEDFQEYKYDEEMFKYIHSLPNQSIYMVEEKFSRTDSSRSKMSYSDWWAMQYGKLSDKEKWDIYRKYQKPMTDEERQVLKEVLGNFKINIGDLKN